VLWFEKMVPTCFFLCLWRESNSRSFEDLEGTLEDIILLFLYIVPLDCCACLSYVD
jgi:hypothetical protein